MSHTSVCWSSSQSGWYIWTSSLPIPSVFPSLLNCSSVLFWTVRVFWLDLLRTFRCFLLHLITNEFLVSRRQSERTETFLADVCCVHSQSSNNDIVDFRGTLSDPFVPVCTRFLTYRGPALVYGRRLWVRLFHQLSKCPTRLFFSHSQLLYVVVAVTPTSDSKNDALC